MEGFGFGTKEEVSVSFLPLSHVTARHVDFALLYRGVALAYCPDIAQLPQVLTEVRPDIFIAVPRVYEKIRQQVILKTVGLSQERYLSLGACGRARSPRRNSGRDPDPRRSPGRSRDRLVFSKVRAGMGGKAEEFISGGAPLGRELAEWYADIGIPIHEGYGLTETSPVIAVNTPRLAQTRHGRQAAAQRRSADCRATARCWCAGPRYSRAIGIVPTKRARRLSMAGSRPATSGNSTRRIPFHHRSQEGSDQDFRREVHRAAADREFAEAEPADWHGGGDWRPAEISRSADRAALPCSGRLGAGQSG